MSKFLSLGLHNPNQLVRALSLTGLSSVLMQPKKVRGPRSTGVGGGWAGGGTWKRASMTGGAGRGRTGKPGGQEGAAVFRGPCCIARGWGPGGF